MYKLIRDNIPAIMAEAKQPCNYAAIQSTDLYIAALREKLIEEVNEFLSPGQPSLEEVADIITVLVAFTEFLPGSLKEVYEQKLASHGGFKKRLLGFFPDKPSVEEGEQTYGN